MENISNHSLYQKYDRPGPRYTSYPAYPHWEQTPTSHQWMNVLKANKSDSLDQQKLDIDLYIHIPYCQSLCFYCGCNRNISKNQELGDEYTDYLLREWALYLAELGDIKISSLHFGGGTPTFLKTQAFKKIFETLSPYLADNFQGSIEIDPRVSTKEQMEYLSSQGIKRFSLGIQDFNYDVQKVINRIQPQKMVEEVLEALRSTQVQSINFDLIYGLPKQTRKTLDETLAIVKKLRPDTIALYSYAHVPWKASAQKALEKHGIAQGEQKRDLYNYCKELLAQAGYKELGLDHFSLETDSLYQAYERGEMKRSFMGYTTSATKHLIGLGVSAISSTDFGHIQNEKEIEDYKKRIDAAELPFFYGHIQSERDLQTSQAIHSIMCGRGAELSSLLKVSSEEHRDKMKASFAQMLEDQLIEWDGENLKVTTTGLPFLRNIAMALDYRLRDTQRFSRTV